jgi:peptidyl-prolyl cis-trans isomerase SurA
MIKRSGVFTKTSLFFIITFLVNVFPVGFCYAATDKIIAVVNGDIIMQSEIQKKVSLTKKQLAHEQAAKIPSDAELRKKILDSEIDKMLQLQIAKKEGITVKPEEVDKSISNIAKRNGVSKDVMRKGMEAEGLSFKDFRKQIEENMIMGRLQQLTLGREITVTDEEAEDFLRKMPKMQAAPSQPAEIKEYHLLNILIPVSDNATKDEKNAARQKALMLVDKLQEGADYDQLLASDSSLKGEDLGWRALPQMPEVFSSEAVKMKPGDAAGAISAPNGFHIIKLVEVRNVSLPAKAMPPMPQAPKLTLREAKEMVYAKKLEDKVDKWVKELRSRAYIKITDNES